MNTPFKDDEEYDDYVLRERTDLDFSKAVRGKYSKAMQNGSNIVLIDLDLLDMFPNQEAVNEALRTLKEQRLSQIRSEAA